MTIFQHYKWPLFSTLCKAFNWSIQTHACIHFVMKYWNTTSCASWKILLQHNSSEHFFSSVRILGDQVQGVIIYTEHLAQIKILWFSISSQYIKSFRVAWWVQKIGETQGECWHCKRDVLKQPVHTLYLKKKFKGLLAVTFNTSEIWQL